MGLFNSYKISGVDHVEFAVRDLDKTIALYQNLGFEKAATREIRDRQLQSALMVQSGINVVLSRSTLPTDPVAAYVNTHGDGICNVAFKCEDAVSALELAVKQGAEVAETPKAAQKDFGAVQRASIRSFGDVRNTFISRQGNLFLEGFDIPMKSPSKGYGLLQFDHLTVNVESGKMDHWAGFYEKIFGFKNTRFFDIHTERTGLYSKVMQSPDGVIKMPFNEPTEAASQIQEFLDIHHGPGIQHIALTTNDVVHSVRSLTNAGFKFLKVPLTYYDSVPKRVPNVSENMSELSELGVLVDGDSKGYLLQIFTQPLIGPFFYEVIQRKGNDGFGEGNFRALFEAMELDQIQRGVLK